MNYMGSGTEQCMLPGTRADRLRRGGAAVAEQATAGHFTGTGMLQ